MIIEFSKDLQLDDWMFADLHERFMILCQENHQPRAGG